MGNEYLYEYGMEKLQPLVEAGDYQGAIRFLDTWTNKSESKYFYFQLLLGDLLYDHGNGDGSLRKAIANYKLYLHVASHGWDAAPDRWDPVGFKQNQDMQFAATMRQMYHGVTGPVNREDINRAKERVAEGERKVGKVEAFGCGSAAAFLLIFLPLLLLLGVGLSL